MDLVRLLSELISVEQMNKIESQAKNLIEPEKEHIIKAFNSGRCRRNGMDKTAEEYFDETFENKLKNLRWYSSFIIFDKIIS
jgi:hypothetical protein